MFEQDPLRDLLLLATIVEVAAFLILATLAALAPRLRHAVRALLRLTEAAGERRWLPAAVFIIATALCAAFAAVHDEPRPRVHDEFSYLLTATTFANGQLAAPEPPVSRHFESEHILVAPTYTSKYPPAQALILALGILLGAPIIGVWLSTAAALAASTWTLQQLTSPKWAGLGALLLLLHPGILVWWGHTYWGGSVAACGGALLIGGVAHAHRRPTITAGFAIALGVAILANARPWEGLLLSIAAALWLLTIAWRHRTRPLPFLATVVAPCILILPITGLAMAKYNEATVGDRLVMPYMVHAERYNAAPMFLWQNDPEDPPYSNRHLADFHAGWEVDKYERHTTFPLWLAQSGIKVSALMGFFLGPAIMLCLTVITLPGKHMCAGRRHWPSITAVALVGAGLLATPYFNPHYAAPLLALLTLASVVIIRRCAARRRAWRCVPLLVVLAKTAGFATAWIAYVPTGNDVTWTKTRDAIISELADNQTQDLVLIRHGRAYTPHETWTYNPPNFDDADVLFAWELDTTSNAELLDAFPNRTPWLVTLYRPEPPTLAPYPRHPNALALDPELLDPAPSSDNTPPQQTAEIDWDRDGQLDRVTLETNADLVIVTLAHAERVELQTDVGPTSLLVRDVTNDGIDDLIVGTRFGHGVCILDPTIPNAAAIITLNRTTWFERKTERLVDFGAWIGAVTPRGTYRLTKREQTTTPTTPAGPTN